MKHEHEEEVIARDQYHLTVWCQRCGAYEQRTIVTNPDGSPRTLEHGWNIPIAAGPDPRDE